MKARITKLISLLILSLLLGGTAFAQSSAANTLSVSPAFVQVELPGPADTRSAMLTLSNTYDTDIGVSVELKGIDDEAGKIVPKGELEQALLGRVALSETDMVVPAHASSFLKIEVSDDGSIPAGGHYATVVITQKIPEAGQLSVRQAVSVGLFIVKRSGTSQKISAGSVLHGQSPFSLPSSADVTIKNDGQVYVVPRTSVQVFARGDVLLGEGIANQDSHLLLSGKQYTESISLKYTSVTYMPQKIKVVTRYRVDGSDQTKEDIKQYWYIPPIWLFTLLVVAVGTLYLIKKRPPKKSPEMSVE